MLQMCIHNIRLVVVASCFALETHSHMHAYLRVFLLSLLEQTYQTCETLSAYQRNANLLKPSGGQS